MKKTIIALALAAGLTSFAGSAKAGLTFNFNFTGSGRYTATKDTVSGNLTLNDANTAATSLYITSITGPTPVTYNSGFNYVFTAPEDWMYQVENNSFTVTSGNITSANFLGAGYGSYGTVQLNTLFGGDYYNNYNYDGINTANGPGGDLAGITFTPVTGGAATAAVPEPSQVAASLLLIAGIAGFVIVKRRKVASALEALAA